MFRALLLVTALSSSATLLAQTPPRDPALRASESMSAVRGRVVGADTGAPLRDAPVTLTPSSGGASQSTRTDLSGFFEFTGLAAGEYRVRVATGPSSARYLPLPDAGTPDRNVPTVRVSEGQMLEGLEIRLQRAAAISGRVLDDYGDPIALVTIRVVQKLSGGRQALRFQGRLPTVTDDQGRFRVFGLPPGRYQLSGEPPISGSGTELAQTRLLPTYYPSTADAAESTIIKLGVGDEVADLELRLVRTGVFTIRGTVVNSRGVPSSDYIVTIMNRRAGGGWLRADAAVEPDGTFLLRNVVAGEYFLAARAKLNAPNLGPSGEFAMLPVSVHNDLDGVVLSTKQWVSVSGRVVLDSAAPESLPSGLLVIASEMDGRPTANVLPASAPVAADGSFTLHNVPDGALLRVMRAPGWWLKSVTVAGQDVTDRPTDFRNGEQRVQIVLTKHGATVVGAATDEDGKPAGGSAVLLFGAEPEQWVARASTTRTVTAHSDGSFTIPVVRPGRYLLVALNPEDLSLQDASTEYFQMLAKLAQPLTVADGPPVKVAAKVSRLPD